MAGLLIQAARAGHRATWIVVTDGAAGKGGRDPDLANIRKSEAEEAASDAGAAMIALGYPDGRLSWQPEALAAIGAQLVSLTPDVIVTHALNDYHPDHRAVARMVVDGAPLGVPIIRADTMLGLHFVPEVLYDISQVFDDKAGALARHESQVALGVQEALRVWNRFRGLQSGPRRFTHAEAFSFDKGLGVDRGQILDRIGGNYFLV